MEVYIIAPGIGQKIRGPFDERDEGSAVSAKEDIQQPPTTNHRSQIFVVRAFWEI